MRHKQSELIRVSDALPECDNLAIDLAYNLVVTSSYMNLMFTWDSGMSIYKHYDISVLYNISIIII